jgi:hypothetical protein
VAGYRFIPSLRVADAPVSVGGRYPARTTGGVAERLNAPVLKTGIRFGGSRVRIPPPPFVALRPVICRAVEQKMNAWKTALVSLPLMLQGCLAGSSPLPAIVEVRDARTGLPVADAVVRTTGGNVFIPPRYLLAPPTSPWANPAGGRVQTGDDGATSLLLAGSRPNELTVTAAGYPPLYLTLEVEQTNIRGAHEWTEGRRSLIEDGTSAGPKLEVRVHTTPEM